MSTYHGFSTRAFSVIVITDGWSSIVVTVHTGAVFAEAGGGVPCSQLPAPVFLFPSVQTSDKIQLGDAGDGAQLLLRYCVCPLQSPSAVSAAGQCWLYLVLVTILSLATILQRQHHIYCHNYTPTTFITAAAPDTHYLSYWTGRGHNIHISIISTTCLLYLSLLGSGCWIYIAWYLPCFI